MPETPRQIKGLEHSACYNFVHMESQYRPRELEPRIQERWAATKAFVAPDASPKPKYYCVSMLPYPSGKLHMGHVRNYTITDALYHFMRMKGWNVLMPMGWGAFGLHAENAAIANKVPPAKWTWENIAYMKKQCQSMGWAIDWTREIATCSPGYYRWNQWFYLRMLEKGMVYRKSGIVNWDPVDMTVLANEQVIDGRGWRTGAEVEKREIPMWYMKMTHYADELLDALDGLGWPESVKQMQRNWIGRSEGIEFVLPYDAETARRMNDEKKGLKVFTTRADTIMGITFAAVAAEHPLAAEASKGNSALAAFVEECKKGAVAEAVIATMEKKGMPTGLHVLHPLRDWGFSRQRYWGTPIPMIQCVKCGDVAVPDDELPVVLPEDLVPDGSGNPLAKTPSFYECHCPKCGGAAKRDTDTMDCFIDSCWYYMRYACPDAAPMLDARAQYWMPMDQYIGGIEHAILHLLYARFWTKAMRDLGLVSIDEPFTNLLTQGMGLNHIFVRKPGAGREVYYAPEELDITLDAEGKVAGATLKADGKPVVYDGIGTMSKSKRNGVDPQDMIDRYGADTARFYVMQASAPTDTVVWSDESVDGSFRFLRRLWTMVHGHVEAGVVARGAHGEISAELKELRFKLHKTIEKVADDYGRRMQFNTAIAAVRELLNLYGDLEDRDPAARAIAQETLEDPILMLSPIVPHICTDLWSALRPGTRLIDQPWPTVDPKALVQDAIELVIQVNGKLRGHLQVPATASREETNPAAINHEPVLKSPNGQKAKKVVVVPGRLVNVVI